MRVLARGLQNATSVDFHFEEGYAFYLDTSAGVIGRAKLDGTMSNSPTVIVSEGNLLIIDINVHIRLLVLNKIVPEAVNRRGFR